MIQMVVRSMVVIVMLGALGTYSRADAVTLKALCSKPHSGHMGCLSRVVSDTGGRPLIRVVPSGYKPNQLRSVYGYSGTGVGKRVAIVGAYNDSSIESDLAIYAQSLGLPPMSACTTQAATACFNHIGQSGAKASGAGNDGWAVETALDVETVHGLCPGCRIDLVEARTDSTDDLMAAEDEAGRLGDQVVSNSWGGSELASETSADTHFATTGVSYVASSGDDGYGVSWPAASTHVIAVGGTTLQLNTANQRTSETAWSDAGSGCSRYESRPAWQSLSSCAGKSVADIAAVADPNTGAAIYAHTSKTTAGWITVGGTSLAAPVISAGIALGKVPPTPQAIAARHTVLYDITSGANGRCSLLTLCQARAGYDGPTGWGVPTGAL